MALLLITVVVIVVLCLALMMMRNGSTSATSTTNMMMGPNGVMVLDPRREMTLQYSDHKYTPDIAYTTRMRPVQQGNILEDRENELSFARLDEDISQGNPVSWSNRPNAPVVFYPNGATNFRYGQNSLCNTLQRAQQAELAGPAPPEIVIQGHGVPLANQLYPSRNEEPSIVPFANLRASPDCCPSTYSTDSGCVCGL